MDSLIVRAEARGLVRAAGRAVRAEVVRKAARAIRPSQVASAGQDYALPSSVIDAPPSGADEPQQSPAAKDETAFEMSLVRGVAAYTRQLRAADERLLDRGLVIRRSA